MGQSRAVQLGVIGHESNDFAKHFYNKACKISTYDIRMNEPYGPSDPVLHMVTRHGDEQKIPNVMLEVRNDLIVDNEGQRKLAQLIADTLNSIAYFS
jgi:predicted N-formylglutamate amidohydrolase